MEKHSSSKHLSLVSNTDSNQPKKLDRHLIDQIKSSNNLIEVAREIGGIDPSAISGSSYLGPCPTGHPSTGNKCCSMNMVVYHCFNCKMSGDVIGFVQDIKYKGRTGETFFLAVKYLADRAGIPLDVNGRAFCQATFEENETAYRVLTSAAGFFHEQLSDELRQFIAKNYGLSNETINRFKIGYATGSGLLAHLKKNGFTDQQALLSGLFLKFDGPYGPSTIEFFNNRILFPYNKYGRVNYFIGRKTKKTPNKDYEKSKYKKLQTFDDVKRPYIAPGIQNDTIFNQDVLSRAKEVVITEGITDCIALDQHGFSTISPVTIHFSKSDTDVLLKILSKDQIIYLCNDNELNAAGEKGAYATALTLSKAGFTVKIITIPLTKGQLDARMQLEKIEG